jgi:hypothetical protein
LSLGVFALTWRPGAVRCIEARTGNVREAAVPSPWQGKGEAGGFAEHDPRQANGVRMQPDARPARRMRVESQPTLALR